MAEEAVSTIFSILETWWWLLLPVFLYFPAKFLYRWWINWEVWYKEQEWIMLEIVPPGEIEKPFRAMEDLYSGLWAVYDSPNWREVWCEGELEKFPFWFSFEIESREGAVHFYLRIPRDARKMAESVIHSHYPEAEIFEVADYTQTVPQNVPNEDYELYGEDYKFIREYSYPIKTYKFFEPAAPEAVVGEKKVDPMNSLMEGLTKIKKGERVWFQIIATPILNREIPWLDKGKELAGQLAKRPGKPKQKSITGGAAELLIFGKAPAEEEKREEPIIPPEMKLTPGEREILGAVEEKITKYGFKVSARAVYIAERDVYTPPHAVIVRGYFPHFSTQNLNGIMFETKTRTKIQYLFRKRRLYQRKRSIFDRYVKRLPPSFPKLFGLGNMIMNTEELATIFHFPTKAGILPPGVPRVVYRRGEPPPGIPTE